LPQARAIELVVTELDGEQLVYDLGLHKMHHLNRISMLVWEACDGKTTAGQVMDRLRELDNQTVDDVLWLALGQLQSASLLDESYDSPGGAGSYSRRSLLKKGLIGGAVALPVLSSLVAPSAIAHASNCSNTTGRLNGCVCSSDFNCISPSTCCTGAVPNAGHCGVANGQANATCVQNSDCCSNNCQLSHNKCTA
jgi:hypothetical protein